jgi:hypothetical protein
MARLPIPGSDDGIWGDVLNDYLVQTHNTDGTLKDGIVTNSSLAANAVTASELADNSISEDKLDADLQTKVNGVGGSTNLAASRTGTSVTITSDTGTDATIDPASASEAGVMSAADKTKLNDIEAGAQVNTVASVAGKTGVVALTRDDVGLGNVDNTSDANKPISATTQAALDNKLEASDLADTPRFIVFSSGWAARAGDSRATFFIGGTHPTDEPTDVNLAVGDLWLPSESEA